MLGTEDGRWKVEVYHYPEDQRTLVLVNRYSTERFRRFVDMKPRSWRTKSPRQKLLEVEAKAHQLARDLNWEMDKSIHEFESTRR